MRVPVPRVLLRQCNSDFDFHCKGRVLQKNKQNKQNILFLNMTHTGKTSSQSSVDAIELLNNRKARIASTVRRENQNCKEILIG